MPQTQKAVLLAVVGCLLGLLSMFAGIYKASNILLVPTWWLWVAVLSGILSIVLVVVAFRLRPPGYEMRFTEKAWKPAPDGFRLIITASEHGLSDPKGAEVYRKTGDGFQKVPCDCRVNPDREVRLRASRPFAGKVVVLPER